MSTLTQFFSDSANSVPVQLLLIGGGAGGGGVASIANASSGGGGAGQLIYCDNLPIKKGAAHAITIGGGGTGGTSNNFGGNGTSSLLGSIEAFGGGGGALVNSATANVGLGQSTLMGSGGGGSSGTGLTGGTFQGGTSQGAFYKIDSGKIVCSGFASSGIDGILSVNAGGDGGSALGNSAYSSSITGTATNYGLGGATTTGSTSGTNATANTGNGGTGCSNGGTGTARGGGNGGSGIVIIAYPDTYAVPTTITGTYTEPTRSGWRVYRFTGSGSITL